MFGGGVVAFETLHKAPAPLLMKWRLLHCIDHSKLSQPIADDPYQRTARALSPLPLPCTVTCSIIYFRRWVMLSGTSITRTLISPLEEGTSIRGVEWALKVDGRGGNILITWCFWSLWAVLGAFSWPAFQFWITNLFQMNFLPAPGVPPSLWHSLHLTCWLLSFPAFTNIHLISLRTSTVGEICNFKSWILPFSVPAPCNSPLFVFHKCKCKTSHWKCFLCPLRLLL